MQEITETPRRTLYMQYLKQIHVHQCRTVAVYLAAFMKMVVRPRLRIGARRRRSGALLSSVMLRFRHKLSDSQPAAAALLHLPRSQYEHSFFWLHSVDPYNI